MYVYIYRYIYKVASKNGFLICNACSHSHSPTLHLFRRYSLCIYSFLFTLSLFFFLYLLNAFSKIRDFYFSFLFKKGVFPRCCASNSLRYLQERLALQHLLPAVPSRYVIARGVRRTQYTSYPIWSSRSEIRVVDYLATIPYRHASGTPRCMNSFDFIYVRVLLTVLFCANRIRYRRGTLPSLTPRGQPNVVQSIRIQSRQCVVLGNRYSAMMLLLIRLEMLNVLTRHVISRA